MPLKLSKKQVRRYNARQLKKWHAKRQALMAAKTKLRQSLAAMAQEPSENRVVINLDGIRSVSDFYQRLEAAVALPDYCAANLDALHDVLTTDISESVQFIWTTAQEDIARGSEGLAGLKSMLENLPQTRADMSISYKGYLS